MREIKMIIIHCSATPNGAHYTVRDIDNWHRARGFRRTYPRANPELTSIGYHYVIYIDGDLHTGRAEEEVGAHAAGYNSQSLGICLIGTDVFMHVQWRALAALVKKLTEKYPVARILGHRDLPDVKKTCPGFDAAAWWQQEKNGGLSADE